MKILALTGSIGMGKSTAAAMLRRMRVSVYSADEAVHALLASGGRGVEKVGSLYPAACRTDPRGRNFIDRDLLSKAVFADKALMLKLEAALHPLVREEEKKFLKGVRRHRHALAVIDIPLLYETRGENRADAVMVVTAPGFLQKQRVLSRRNMTPEKLKGILDRQMSGAEKRKRADFIVPTGLGRGFTWKKLRKIMAHFQLPAQKKPARVKK
ncbi:MAG: dephospho-CoA kinase [Proteobacteria bacterium]|nr:dephospho-CoA kinase [Pseudomonadota bacterium]